MNQIEDFLDICIITYNRASFLEATISKFLNSPFKNCRIIIIDNCSTDNTKAIVEKYADKVEFHCNRFNIGGNANILRAFEYGTSPYVWIIGDDDDYDFEYTEDLNQVLKKGEIDLIHVGAHTDVEWKYGGQTVRTRSIVERGYPFFRFSSFIGCNIIKRKEGEKFIIKGYNNIANSYPHMPFLLSFYEENKPIYISQKRIAKAVIGNQCYTNDSLIKWWGETCKLLKHREDQKRCFFQQFYSCNKYKQIICWRYQYYHNQLSQNSYSSLLSFFSKSEKVISILVYPAYLIYLKFVSIIS